MLSPHAHVTHNNFINLVTSTIYSFVLGIRYLNKRPRLNSAPDTGWLALSHFTALRPRWLGRGCSRIPPICPLLYSLQPQLSKVYQPSALSAIENHHHQHSCKRNDWKLEGNTAKYVRKMRKYPRDILRDFIHGTTLYGHSVGYYYCTITQRNPNWNTCSRVCYNEGYNRRTPGLQSVRLSTRCHYITPYHAINCPQWQRCKAQLQGN